MMFHYKIDIRTLEGVRINAQEESEINYWVQKLECTREDLMKAIKAVGTSAENVTKFLR